jgi:hypothetical protein
MKKPNHILLGFIGYILSICVAPPLWIEGYWILGSVSFISGLAVIDYNRGGN